MEKQLKQLLKEYKILFRTIGKTNNWFIETNRRYMQLEQDNHYLKWKNEYLEKWIKKNNPDAKLFAEDRSEYDAIRKEQSNDIQ